MYHPAVPQEPRDDEPRDDDPPKWVREVRRWYAPKPEPEQQPDMPPLPNVTDTQRRCVICECLLIFDAPADAQTCAAHRLAEIVRANVQSGSVTEWPASLDYCGVGAQNHVSMQTIAPERATFYWLGSLQAVLSFYNALNDTHYRWL